MNRNTNNLPPIVNNYGAMSGSVERYFFVSVGNLDKDIYVRSGDSGSYLSTGSGEVIEDYLSIPEVLRVAFEIQIYAEIKQAIRRLKTEIETRTAQLAQYESLRG